MPLVLALGRERQVDLCEFEASLAYRSSSRTAREILLKQNKTKRNKQTNKKKPNKTKQNKKLQKAKNKKYPQKQTSKPKTK